MGLFGWFERKLFLGEVVRDYGVVAEQSLGLGRLTTSVLLCRRGGRLNLMFRNAGRAPLGVSVQYVAIEATPAALAKLAEVISDAQETATAEQP